MIQVSDLTKYFDSKRALGPVSFEIDDGESVGLLGLNGAGKTTALRILACDLRPSAGSVKVGGVDAVADPHEVRKQVGFLPENAPLYPEMPVAEYLIFSGQIRGMTREQARKRLPTVLKVTHLTDVQGDLIRTLSHGYRQRVGLAQSVMHQPKLVILDEPTRGLDPVQIVEMRSMIRDLKKAHTILISSHILPEISETCDRLLVLGEGKIVGQGTEAELSAGVAAVQRLIVHLKPAGKPDEAVEQLKEIEGVTEVSITAGDVVGEPDGTVSFAVTTDGDVRPVVCRTLVEKGHDLLRLERAQQKLETIFLELVKGASRARN